MSMKLPHTEAKHVYTCMNTRILKPSFHTCNTIKREVAVRAALDFEFLLAPSHDTISQAVVQDYPWAGLLPYMQQEMKNISESSALQFLSANGNAASRRRRAVRGRVRCTTQHKYFFSILEIQPQYLIFWFYLIYGFFSESSDLGFFLFYFLFLLLVLHKFMLMSPNYLRSIYGASSATLLRLYP